MAAPSAPNELIKRTSTYAGANGCNNIDCCGWYEANSVDRKLAYDKTQITGLRETLKQKDSTLLTLEQTINANRMYRRGPFDTGSPMRLYRTADGKDYRANQRDEVYVPVADLQALEQKIERLQKTVLDASADAVEAGARLRESKAEENKSQQIIDAQATVIRNQKQMIAELQGMYASPFMVFDGVKIVPNAFVQPGQIIAVPEKLYVTHDFNVVRLQQNVNDLQRRNENQARALKDTLALLNLKDIHAIAPAIKELSEHKNSYMAIIAEIRKVLGITDVTPGTEIIAYAKQVVLQRDVTRREVRDLSTFLRQKNNTQQGQLNTIAGLRRVLTDITTVASNRNFGDWYALGEIRNLLHKFYTQPTTGATQAPSGSRS